MNIVYARNIACVPIHRHRQDLSRQAVNLSTHNALSLQKILSKKKMFCRVASLRNRMKDAKSWWAEMRLSMRDKTHKQIFLPSTSIPAKYWSMYSLNAPIHMHCDLMLRRFCQLHAIAMYSFQKLKNSLGLCEKTFHQLYNPVGQKAHLIIIIKGMKNWLIVMTIFILFMQILIDKQRCALKLTMKSNTCRTL